MTDSFSSKAQINTNSGPITIYRLAALERAGLVPSLAALPYSIRILLESVLRNVDGFAVEDSHVKKLCQWTPTRIPDGEIPFKPARVVLQDFTGVPALVDFAAMRSAMARAGGDPKRINPIIPADLVIDHSVQVDSAGKRDSLALNAKLEFHRNRERYEFLRWGQKALNNFTVVPPATGIVHQVNLEYLAKGVFRRQVGNESVAVPDTLVGTDSHTTMINGLGVLGWGVGGIEAEAAMLGQPLYMLIPEVVGFRLTGKLREGATATDLVLRVTEMLRKHGVVEKFVEFYGEGLSHMDVANRATIGNMAPEYGATVGFFPVDDRTLEYMRFTGRSPADVDLVERYYKEQGLFRTDKSPDPQYTTRLELDLGTVEPSLAGPRRPQDRIALSAMKTQWRTDLGGKTFSKPAAVGQPDANAQPVSLNGASFKLRHGAVVIAAITSCTNTSNPSVMLAAGLVARKAVQKGLKVPPWVKTSLAPGSRVVTDYYDKGDFSKDLDALGFQTVGYGCTTCIGNSGPLPSEIEAAIAAGDLVVTSVLSGNRNFEARIHPLVKANYLASPPLVVAYALAGTTDIDLVNEPLGRGADGKDVFLRDIWPTQAEIASAVANFVTPEMFANRYADVFAGDDMWKSIPVNAADVYEWREDSTYIQEPPFFENLSGPARGIAPIENARCLVMVGDSVTTDHISPAGDINAKSPAGQFLLQKGVDKADFNSYGARRGNDRVMTRGTFANVRIKNLLAPGTEGGVTTYLGRNGTGAGGPSAGATAVTPVSAPGATAVSAVSSSDIGQQMSIYDAAMKYKQSDVPLVVLAGKDYGMGSSRDWAAKGAMLLGVKAVIAVSYERIHRTNLVCMGVLPLQFRDGESRETLGLTGQELFSIPGLTNDLQPQCDLQVIATDPKSGQSKTFTVRNRIDTAVEIEYYRNGGVLQTVLRKMLNTQT